MQRSNPADRSITPSKTPQKPQVQAQRLPAEDGGGHGDGLDVGDGGGAAEHAHVGGERRLQAGLALLGVVVVVGVGQV